MIELGTCDANVDDAACQAYLASARRMMLGTDAIADFGTQLRGEGEWKGFTRAAGEAMKVVEIQEFLQKTGFFPFGKLDGICGYRTTAAIRLFQEYVRTVDADAGFTPDGKWGPATTRRAQAWPAGKVAEWSNWSAASPSPICAAWLRLLAQVKAKYGASPGPMLERVKVFQGATDTVKVVGQWNVDPNRIHFIGVRRRESVVKEKQTFDDIFILLVRGLAFTFFGTTEPAVLGDGAAAYPFLVIGQHRYKFGWHKSAKPEFRNKVFQALKPAGAGVLVARSKDLALTDADVAGGLTVNGTINAHWGPDPSWSAGCQVMQGLAYVDHAGRKQDCSGFSATGYAALGTKNARGAVQTKGAYTFLSDLVTALSGGGSDDNIVHYMLVSDADLALDAEAARLASDALKAFGSA
jgi:peptidoglycan hydrolase-like protein with peptidoglycan-binding domain